MRPLVILAAALALASLSGNAGAQAQAAGATVFEGARLILGDGRVIEGASLVVEGDRIAQVGRAADVKPPAGARHVNLTGKTVMPAIIDTHVHTTATREGLTRDLKRRAVFGVGAVMSMGQDPFDILPVRAQPIPGAARFFSAGRGITRPEPGRTTAPYWIDTEAEARSAVGELAAQKVDLVKIWVDDRDGTVPKMTPALFGAVIDEAHRNGLRVSAHVHTLEDTKAVMRSGVDALAHSVREGDSDDEYIALARQRPNLVVNPNLPARGVKTDMSPLAARLTPEETRALEQENVDLPQARATYAFQARSLAKLNAAGVKIVLGTDGNRSWGPHVEMEDMVVAGMTPAQVIVAATKNGAEFLRIADAGTLEPGKSADFIVLDANPLEDITNTRRISAVYLRGAAVE